MAGEDRETTLWWPGAGGGEERSRLPAQAEAKGTRKGDFCLFQDEADRNIHLFIQQTFTHTEHLLPGTEDLAGGAEVPVPVKFTF